MSLKEISDLLKDLIESNKQISLRIRMIEIEIKYIKENILGKITNFIEKTDKIDKRISEKYIKELLNKKSTSENTYQKGSMDEILIQKFLEKQKGKEKYVENENDLETNHIDNEVIEIDSKLNEQNNDE